MTDLWIALAIAVGLAGTIVPILPGALLVAGAIIVWAVLTGGTTAWAIAIGALAIIGAGQLLKYLIPGKQMKASGVPNWVLVVGGVGAVVGFFVIPVVGLVIGFIAGVFVAEAFRLKTFKDAWPTTVQAMKSAGWSVLIEFGSCLLAAALWAGGALVVL
ncbi:MAG: DUF456 domain-containing protein [Actinobacteria bacterium]|nr:DUF456 domain-containing protein [Actinomycetota bacterium]MCB8996926.1 DUF456 domain-containing protein [Actinomycetota bacterium]MCB9414080.1 DUF456 domain-containing protein [Actinomycetota bacterium]